MERLLQRGHCAREVKRQRQALQMAVHRGRGPRNIDGRPKVPKAFFPEAAVRAGHTVR